ncbi:MAG: DUF262 domain-containing protein [Devosia sp.]
MAEDDDDPDLVDDTFPVAGSKPTRTPEQIAKAEGQIVKNIKDVRYIVREYPAEVVAKQYLKGRGVDKNEIFVPDYQRDLVWQDKKQSRFIESLLIGLPVPFIFVADVSAEEDPDSAGRLEIVDGVQRIRTLARFLTDELALSGLMRLDALNGFRFSDLPPSRQRRFKRSTLRLIELTEAVTEDVRRDMFDRINTGSVRLEDVEVRRGMEPGPFLILCTELAADPLLHQLAPISEALAKRFEYEELVTRFFAFKDRFQIYGTGEEGKVVREFLLSYVKDMNLAIAAPGGQALSDNMRDIWKRTLEFVHANYPHGFQKKSGPGRKVPRVRFEAIAVGTALALQENPDLTAPDVTGWLDSPAFKEWTTSDAANNRSNLVGRVTYVRDKLLGQ